MERGDTESLGRWLVTIAVLTADIMELCTGSSSASATREATEMAGELVNRQAPAESVDTAGCREVGRVPRALADVRHCRPVNR